MANQNNLLMITGNDDTLLNHNTNTPTIPDVKRADFPEDFVFGAATSAYQVEGAWNVAGKGLSNWDVFTQCDPGKIADGSNGCTAINQYNFFKDDVALLKKLGLQSYRFSIAWTRILPGGRLSSGLCKAGIKYYNDLIDALLVEGIEPCVTLFPWDVPECLELEYQGFLSRRIVQDFCEFVEVCFWEFGDRVKRWITLNEPWSFTLQGFTLGLFPPSRGATALHLGNALKNFPLHRTKPGPRPISTAGNPGTEPYIVAHNLILAHAHAVDIYRKRYQTIQGGQIGMTNVSTWCEPLTDTEVDKEAASRAIDFMLGWFVAPIVTGDYPESMRENVGERLPEFTEEEEKLVKESYDFLGINYYTAHYTSNLPLQPGQPHNYQTDQRIKFSTERNGMPIGPPAGSEWLLIVPWGIYKLVTYVKNTYGDPIIYITENGVCEKNDKTLNVQKSLYDVTRIRYHNDHLLYLKKAMDKGVRVKGYYIWSLFDNYEWSEGYTVRFGIFFIDFVNGSLTRFPKRSAIWWMNFLAQKPVIPLKKQAKATDQNGQGSVKRLRSS
ncbi:Beta-glucosidase 17 [Forsythia ovata]|uniref:Beta-glucosidase 17 n=1 Tax=Forsythia ovata TaxID=205694 RepID=A0ABD1SRC5_9LAMI